MIVYEAESEISDLIKESLASEVTASLVLSEQKEELFKDSVNKMESGSEVKKIFESTAMTKDFDLLYCSSILASSIFNKNDDIFLAEEMWAAKESPINKPFNKDHEKKKIIGHIIGARCFDESKNEVLETPCNDNHLDIEVDCVVYKRIFPETADEIIQDGAYGRKFVSMECVMEGFDYGIFDEHGELTIVERNEETSFLTKHLRIYKGEGVYNNRRIGRVLRKITFTGVGLVNKPANPTSKFTKIGLQSELKTVESNQAKVTETNMDKNDDKKTDAQAQVESILAEKDSAIASITKELGDSSAKVKSLEDTIAGEKLKLDSAMSKISQLETQIAEITETVKAKDLEITEAKKKMDETKCELDKYTSKAKLDARLAAYSEAGFVDVNDEVKASIEKMSDETFEAVIAFNKNFAKKQEAKSETKEETTASDINSAKSDEKPDITTTAGASATETDELHETAASLVKMLYQDRKNKKTLKVK